MTNNTTDSADTYITSIFSALMRVVLFACAAMASFTASAGTDKDTVRWDDRSGQWIYTLYNPSDLSRSKEIR